MPVALWYAYVKAGREKRAELEARVSMLERHLLSKAGPDARDVVAAVADRTRSEVLDTVPKYLGVWQEGQEYAQHSICTRSAGLWFAKSRPTAVPGSDSTAWQLIVKSGGQGPKA